MDNPTTFEEWCYRRLNAGKTHTQKTVEVEKALVVPVKKEDDFDMYLTAVKKRFHHIIGDRECVISCRLVDTINGYVRRYYGQMSHFNNHNCTDACFDGGEGEIKHNMSLHNNDLDVSVRKTTEERPYDSFQPNFKTAVEEGPLVIKVMQEGKVVLQIANYIKRHWNREIGPLQDKLHGTFKFFVPPTLLFDNKRILDYSNKIQTSQERIDSNTIEENYWMSFIEVREAEITQNLLAYGFTDDSDKDYLKKYNKISAHFGSCKELVPITAVYFALCMKQYAVELIPGCKGHLPQEIINNIVKYIK